MELAPAVVVGAITTALFVADFLGIMQLVCMGLVGLGLIGAVDAGLRIRRGGRVEDLPQALAWTVTIVLFFVLYAINRQQMFHEWDEFSHWGTIIKAIFGANTFHLVPNPLYFQDYPPGTALFAYFVLTILGYSEGGAYFAYALIILAHCIPIFGLARRQGPLALAISVGASLLLVRLLGHGWASVLIDHILSVCFAGLVSGYLLVREAGARRWPLALLVITLMLAKHAGNSLALVAVGLMAIDTLIIELGNQGRSRGGYAGRLAAAAVASGSWGLLLAPAMGLSVLWNQYVEANGLVRGYGRFGLLDLFRRGLDCCSSERERIIVTRYLDHWLGLPDALSQALPVAGPESMLGSYLASRLGHLGEIAGYSPMLLTIALAAVGALAIWRSTPGTARLRQAGALFTLVGASLLFATVQLLFYLYAFSDYEALGIASFKRFQNTYFLAWALSGLAWLALARRAPSAARRARPRSWRSMVYWGLVGVALVLGGRALMGSRIGDAQRAERVSIRDWVSSLPLPPGNGGRIFIVWQGSNGFEFWETHHEVLPRVTNRDCYSLGPPHFTNDIWSCPWDEARVRNEWAGYDYILVAHGYADLHRQYPNLVPDLGPAADRELLRVDREGAAVILQPQPRTPV